MMILPGIVGTNVSGNACVHRSMRTRGEKGAPEDRSSVANMIVLLQNGVVSQVEIFLCDCVTHEEVRGGLRAMVQNLSCRWRVYAIRSPS